MKKIGLAFLGLCLVAILAASWFFLTPIKISTSTTISVGQQPEVAKTNSTPTVQSPYVNICDFSPKFGENPPNRYSDTTTLQFTVYKKDVLNVAGESITVTYNGRTWNYKNALIQIFTAVDVSSPLAEATFTVSVSNGFIQGPMLFDDTSISGLLKYSKQQGIEVDSHPYKNGENLVEYCFGQSTSKNFLALS